jgi:hypothetical protein
MPAEPEIEHVLVWMGPHGVDVWAVMAAGLTK